MGITKSKGNMYPFVSHTWNVVKGKCPHNCTYCYMKKFKLKKMRFDKKELKTDLGSKNFIFIGSSCDMWAEEVSEDWILQILEYCKKFKNKYLFQSKNPARFLEFEKSLPKNSILGTTIETNRPYTELGLAPSPTERAIALSKTNFKRMITVEPIFDFDLPKLLNLIFLTKPEWVNIGADSKGHNLPEPEPSRIKKLIEAIESSGIEVKIKKNLRRIYGT